MAPVQTILGVGADERHVWTLEASTPDRSPNLKRKRGGSDGSEPKVNTTVEDVGQPSSQEATVRERRRRSPAAPTTELSPSHPDSGSDEDVDDCEPIAYWIQKRRWPSTLFEPDFYDMSSLTRKRSTPSLGTDEQSGSTPVSVREGKNPMVRSPRYESILASVGIHMGRPSQPPTDAAKAFCQTLLAQEQAPPQDSIFRDDRFEAACEEVRNRNEARVIQDIARLIVPSPGNLTLYGAGPPMLHLAETVSEGWLKSIPLVTGPRPQPDFAVGLRPSAFSAAQLHKLSPHVGDWRTSSRLVATDDVYFPFLTAEVKCGNAALDIADRQNAHSASVAVNALVELYRAISREDEVHRQILAFSISHDARGVRIYGHYPVLGEGDKRTLFCRHLIKSFDILSEDGKEKWTAYQFTRNVYDQFVPVHLQRICAAIEALPEPEVFAVDALPQPLESERPGTSGSTPADSQESGTGRPSSQTTRPVFKKPKGKGSDQTRQPT
ncbi:MAG: hypothetical protein M1817_003881 [Caeruleum heppii]|nr:MAG: hypothetical protein M1817_003881 [Caeruleum heppii]